MLRVLICEDEPLARLHLRELIAAHPALTLVGEAADGDAALAQLEALRPDVVFLDIQMPGRDGLSVIQAATHQPAVVFTTAYDAHALEAFELGAVDYLLKPFGAERFQKAVTRLTAKRTGSAQHPATDAAPPTPFLVARHGGRLIPIAVDEISHLIADDDLVQVHVRGRRVPIGETLGRLERRLDPRRFVRVHRSTIVNLAFVTALEPRDAERLAVRLRDGSLLPASRAGTKALRRALAPP